MKKNLYLLFVLFTLAALLLAGCGKAEEAISDAETAVEEAVEDVEEALEDVEEEAEEAVGDIALKITGLVTNEMAWTEAEVRAMDAITVQSINKDGEVKDYTGVSLNALLALAGLAPNAADVVFVADDGNTAEVTLAELDGCTDCIISFRDQAGFSTVLPAFPNSLQVKGVVEIQVK